jgi:molecular chaperone HtpG
MVGDIRQVGVELSNLVKLPGDNIYSTPEAFLRELVQNAQDAITRRLIEAPPGADAAVPAILVTTATDAKIGKLLVIEDNGSGLTLEEIHRDLATIGRGIRPLLR